MPGAAGRDPGYARTGRAAAASAEARKGRVGKRQAETQWRCARRGDNMNWELFYLICFILGFVLCTLSFLTGTLHLHLPTKWHVHVGKGLGATGGVSILNSFSLMAFVTWFGAMGYLMTRHSSLWFGMI